MADLPTMVRRCEVYVARLVAGVRVRTVGAILRCRDRGFEGARMTFERPLGALLRASVASDGPSLDEVAAGLPPEAFDGLARAARFHGIPGYVYRATAGLRQLPGSERDLLAELRRETVRRHLRAIGDLRFLAGVLDAASIPWLVFKGPALAGPVHGSPELRFYRDLDLLIPPARFGAAVEVLEAAGCQVPVHDWRYFRDGLKGEIDVFMPSGTHLDLHWHLVNEIPTRQPYTIDLAGLFERRHEIAVGTDRFPTLSYPDTAVYVALHAMLSPTQRLIGMKDLQLLLETPALRFEGLLAHARMWRVELPFLTAVRQMQRTIGPAAGVRPPSPTGMERAWEGVCGASGRISPLERQDGSPSFGRLVSRSVRDDARASLRLLVRNAGIVARQGASGAGRRSGTRQQPSEVRQPFGHDLEGRARYFEAVARQ